MQLLRLAPLIFAAFTFSSSVLAQAVSVRSDNWYPMNGDPAAEKAGYMIEIVKLALEKAGHTLDYQLMPWERSIDAVRRGEFDCIVGAAKSDAPDFVFPEESLGIVDMAFYGRTDDTFTYTLENLKTKKIAVISGYAYDEGVIDEYITSGASNITITKGDTALEKNIKMLQAQRVEIVIEAPAVMDAQLAEMGLQDKVKRLAAVGEPSDIYLACSPAKATSKEYTQLISAEVIVLRASGELNKILSKYGLSDWK